MRSVKPPSATTCWPVTHDGWRARFAAPINLPIASKHDCGPRRPDADIGQCALVRLSDRYARPSYDRRPAEWHGERRWVSAGLGSGPRSFSPPPACRWCPRHGRAPPAVPRRRATRPPARRMTSSRPGRHRRGRGSIWSLAGAAARRWCSNRAQGMPPTSGARSTRGGPRPLCCPPSQSSRDRPRTTGRARSRGRPSRAAATPSIFPEP